MKRTALYLLGLMLVVVAAWVLLTQTDLAPFVPATLVAVVLLVILGFGVMGLARTTETRTEVREHETQEGDTRVRKSTLRES